MARVVPLSAKTPRNVQPKSAYITSSSATTKSTTSVEMPRPFGPKPKWSNAAPCSARTDRKRVTNSVACTPGCAERKASMAACSLISAARFGRAISSADFTVLSRRRRFEQSLNSTLGMRSRSSLSACGDKASGSIPTLPVASPLSSRMAARPPTKLGWFLRPNRSSWWPPNVCTSRIHDCSALAAIIGLTSRAGSPVRGNTAAPCVGYEDPPGANMYSLASGSNQQ